ncbi:27637_t:CDS:1, partial [Gigaspora margarita]
GIEEIKPDPQKANKLDKLLPLKNISQLRAFLGLALYYRRFIEEFFKKGWTFTQTT